MINERLYIKYFLPYKDILSILDSLGNIKTVTFFIDLQNIARGLYNRKTIEREISNYDETKKIFTLPYELFEYVKKLHNLFSKYDPFFIIFYDNGYSRYHVARNKEYKAHRKIAIDEESKILLEIFSKIKRYYFSLIYEVFNNYDNCIVIYLNDYETDFIPHYIIQNNYLDTNTEQNVNFLLSTDKDMLQTTKFINTYQVVSTYKNKKYQQRIYDKRLGLKYIYPNFKPGIIDTEHVPLILSIAGDDSDNIPGIKGYGYKKAIDLIIKYQLKPDLSNIDVLTDKLGIDNVKQIKQNYELISFDHIIKHLNKDALAEVDKFFV